MTTIPIPNLLPALPEIFVFSRASAILLIDLFLSERRRAISFYLAQATLAGAAALTLQGMNAAPVTTFQDMFVSDMLAGVLKLTIYLVTFFAFAYSRDYLRDRNVLRSEYFVLGLFGVVGAMV